LVLSLERLAEDQKEGIEGEKKKKLTGERIGITFKSWRGIGEKRVTVLGRGEKVRSEMSFLKILKKRTDLRGKDRRRSRKGGRSEKRVRNVVVLGVSQKRYGAEGFLVDGRTISGNLDERSKRGG